jgi:hypothetical protein
MSRAVVHVVAGALRFACGTLILCGPRHAGWFSAFILVSLLAGFGEVMMILTATPPSALSVPGEISSGPPRAPEMPMICAG